MSFANVSHPRHNEAFYQKALALLLRASQIEGHEMNEHLKSFVFTRCTSNVFANSKSLASWPRILSLYISKLGSNNGNGT